mgnify:CR=1 FL=1
MAFVRMDIDRFQLINAFFGTSVGDEVLRFVADSVKQYVTRFEKATYGRVEADVFGMCLRYEDVNSALKRIYAIRNHFKSYPLEFDIVPAFGIYVIEDKDIPIELMLDRAKLAAKTIKGQYLNNYAFYSDDIGLALEEEQQIVNEMANALEQEQFLVYFQPKYNVKSRQPVGAEALVRMLDDDGKIVPPMSFIPYLEKTGMIIKLDFCVLEQVCKLIRNWLDEGIKPIRISVNLSRFDFQEDGAWEKMLKMISEYNIPREYLEFEVTETIFYDDVEFIISKLRHLRAKGHKVSMDDFGSGYSSLNTVGLMPIDIIKFDRGFVQNSINTQKGLEIMSGLVDIFSKINLEVICEGVETEEEEKTIQQCGCDYVQGYFHDRPLPVADFEAKYIRK